MLVGFADRAAAASGLGCRRVIWAFVEVELQRKNQGDVKTQPGAVQSKGCSNIYLCSSSLGYPQISHLKVTNGRIGKCLWSLQLCCAQPGDLSSEGLKTSVGCDMLCK